LETQLLISQRSKWIRLQMNILINFLVVLDILTRN